MIFFCSERQNAFNLTYKDIRQDELACKCQMVEFRSVISEFVENSKLFDQISLV